MRYKVITCSVPKLGRDIYKTTKIYFVKDTKTGTSLCRCCTYYRARKIAKALEVGDA